MYYLFIYFFAVLPQPYEPENDDTRFSTPRSSTVDPENYQVSKTTGIIGVAAEYNGTIHGIMK